MEYVPITEGIRQSLMGQQWVTTGVGNGLRHPEAEGQWGVSGREWNKQIWSKEGMCSERHTAVGNTSVG